MTVQIRISPPGKRMASVIDVSRWQTFLCASRSAGGLSLHFPVPATFSCLRAGFQLHQMIAFTQFSISSYCAPFLRGIIQWRCSPAGSRHLTVPVSNNLYPLTSEFIAGLFYKLLSKLIFAVLHRPKAAAVSRWLVSSIWQTILTAGRAPGSRHVSGGGRLHRSRCIRCAPEHTIDGQQGQAAPCGCGVALCQSCAVFVNTRRTPHFPGAGGPE